MDAKTTKEPSESTCDEKRGEDEQTEKAQTTSQGTTTQKTSGGTPAGKKIGKAEKGKQNEKDLELQEHMSVAGKVRSKYKVVVLAIACHNVGDLPSFGFTYVPKYISASRAHKYVDTLRP